MKGRKKPNSDAIATQGKNSFVTVSAKKNPPHKPLVKGDAKDATGPHIATRAESPAFARDTKRRK